MNRKIIVGAQTMFCLYQSVLLGAQENNEVPMDLI